MHVCCTHFSNLCNVIVFLLKIPCRCRACSVKDLYNFDLFLTKKKWILNVIWTNELNLTSWIELFANFKRTELELKKKSVSNSNRVSSWTNPYRVESSSYRFDSTRLISSPIYEFFSYFSINLLLSPHEEDNIR